MKPIIDSKKVIVKRIEKSYDLTHSGPKSDFYAKIGSALSGRSHLKGLDFEEEAKYLPNIINVSADANEFPKEAAKYWNNISVNVPEEGLELEVGWRYPSEEAFKEESKKPEKQRTQGVPLELADYILHRYCLVYNKVANSPEEAGLSPKIKFFLYSKSQADKDKRGVLADKLEAQALFAECIGNEIKTKAVLRNWDVNIDVDGMTRDELDLQLEEFVTKMPKRFKEIYEDSNMMTKAFINDAIRVGRLSRAKHSEAIMFGTTALGRSLDEAVANLLSGIEDFEIIRNSLEAELGLTFSVKKVVEKEEKPKATKTDK